MEERVKFLENELQKFAESFEELTYHYSTIHNFLLQHFGATFKNFVLADNTNTSVVTGGEDDDNGDYLNDGEEQDGGGDEDTNLDSYYEEEDHAEVSPVQEEPYVHVTPVKSVKQQQQSSSTQRNGTNQVIKNNMRQQNVSRQPTTSSGGRGLQITKMIPQLIQRPGTSSQSQLHKNFMQPTQQRAVVVSGRSNTSATPNTSSIVSIRPVIGGNRGNEILLSNDDADFKAGKYSKFYSKVNDELIQCKMCHKILKRRGKFIQHLRTHTGEKPFQCEFCPATFSRKDNKHVHVSKHHSPEGNGSSNSRTMQQQQFASTITTASSSSNNKSLYAYKCQLCSKLFANEKIYEMHVKLVHPSNDDEEDNDDNENGDYDDQDYYDQEEAEPMEMMEMEGQGGGGGNYVSYGYDDEEDTNYLEEGSNEFEENDFLLQDDDEGQ